jgi:ABC-type multidrug transport system ATPase subunit
MKSGGGAGVWRVCSQRGRHTNTQTHTTHTLTHTHTHSLSLSLAPRQLLCIARAMLRQPKLVVMDEAMASVDPRSDELARHAIATAFSRDCTFLVIAHRLSTIVDCDSVMVLDGGRVVEFDSPERLLFGSVRGGSGESESDESGEGAARRMPVRGDNARRLKPQSSRLAMLLAHSGRSESSAILRSIAARSGASASAGGGGGGGGG